MTDWITLILGLLFGLMLGYMIWGGQRRRVEYFKRLTFQLWDDLGKCRKAIWELQQEVKDLRSDGDDWKLR